MTSKQKGKWVNNIAWRNAFGEAFNKARRSPLEKRDAEFKACHQLIDELMDQNHNAGILTKDIVVIEEVMSSNGSIKKAYGFMPWLIYTLSISSFDEEDEQKSMGLVRYAHQSGGDVNQAMNEDNPANSLMFAIMSQSLPLTEYLLEHGAHPNSQDEQGITPLMMCFKNYFDTPANRVRLVQLLLKHGANTSQRDSHQKNVLHHVLECAHRVDAKQDFINEFIRHGADVNARDDSGDTPIHTACIYQTSPDSTHQWIQSFVKHGANLHLKNNQGKTALEFALRFGNEEQKASLKEWALVQQELKELEEAVPGKKDKTDSAPTPSLRL